MARQATPDLLGEAIPADDPSLAAMIGAPGTSVRRDGIQDVPVGMIDDNPFQPRVEYSGIEELAADIAANGLLQVPKGRRTADGRVQLQYGHRRLRAVIQLGWKTMPVEVQTQIVDHDMAVRAWSENHNRQDFTAIDQARYFHKLIDAGWTQKAIAERLGLSAPTISNTLRLLELPEDIQAKVAEKQLSARQGEALVSLMSLPESIRETGERRWEDNTRPSSIVRAALDGASSDVIRQRTTDLIRLSTTAVHDEPWYDMVLSDDAGVIVSSTCKSCLATIKRDSGVFCTGPAECLKARADQWALGELKVAAAELGIPAYGMEPRFGHFQDMNSYDTRDLFKELQAQGGCPHGNLQLAYKKDRWGKGPFESFPNVNPICAHGEGHKCRCLMARQREQAVAGTANKTTESVGKRLVAEAAAVLAEALTTVPEGILRHVWAPMVDYTLEAKETEGLSRDEFAMRMAVQILRRKVDNYNSIQTNKDRIEKILQGAGLVSPWTLAAILAPEPEPSGQEERRQELWERVRERAVKPMPAVPEPTAAVYNVFPSTTSVNDAKRRRYESLLSGEPQPNNGYIEPTVDRESPEYISHKLGRIRAWLDYTRELAAGGIATIPEAFQGNLDNLIRLGQTIEKLENEQDQASLRAFADLLTNELEQIKPK